MLVSSNSYDRATTDLPSRRSPLPPSSTSPGTGGLSCISHTRSLRDISAHTPLFDPLAFCVTGCHPQAEKHRRSCKTPTGREGGGVRRRRHQICDEDHQKTSLVPFFLLGMPLTMIEIGWCCQDPISIFCYFHQLFRSSSEDVTSSIKMQKKR